MDRILILPRHVVAYPGEIVTLSSENPAQDALVKAALANDEPLGLILGEPTPDGESVVLTEDAVGTAARVLVHERSPGGRGQTLLAAESRFRILRVAEVDPFPRADIEWLDEKVGDETSARELERSVRRRIDHQAGPDALDAVEGPVDTSYAVAAAVTGPVDLKQRLLSADSAVERLGMEHALLDAQDTPQHAMA